MDAVDVNDDRRVFGLEFKVVVHNLDDWRLRVRLYGYGSVA